MAVTVLHPPPRGALRVRALLCVERAAASGTLVPLSMATGVGLSALLEVLNEGIDTLAPADVGRLAGVRHASEAPAVVVLPLAS